MHKVMKIMFSLDFSSPGTVFLIYGSETHVKMAQRRLPKWLRDAFQNGSDTHAKMAQRRIPKWLRDAFQNGMGC